jgi:hypothetical protein
MASQRVRIGCSGWSYAHWRGGLYPEGLPQRRWLERYAAVFDTVEINATLEAELKAVKPTGLLALGGTVAKALFGPSVRVTRDRGRLIDSPLAPVAALTLHPSAILRLRDHDEREDAFAGLVDDLRLVAAAAPKR